MLKEKSKSEKSGGGGERKSYKEKVNEKGEGSKVREEKMWKENKRWKEEKRSEKKLRGEERMKGKKRWEKKWKKK